MKTTEISIKVDLDENKIPKQIRWDATDKPSDSEHETKAICVSMWDHTAQNTLRIDLWTDQMPLDDMKKFYIDCIGGLGQSLLTATGDQKMANEINESCERLLKLMKQ